MEEVDKNTVGEKRIKFLGKGEDYFKIWIVNLLLTIVTFGFYGPWAKIRAKKYLSGVSEFEGNRFDYHAEPIPLLIGRILAAVIFYLYFMGATIHPYVGILGFIFFVSGLPFFLIKTYKFNFKNTSYRNVRFKLTARIDETYKKYFKVLGIAIGMNLLIQIVSSFMPAMDPAAKEVTLSPILIISLVLSFGFVIYSFYLFPRVLHQFYTIVYNNTLLGNTRTSINSSIEKVKKEIQIPAILYSLKVLLIAILTLVIFVVPMSLLGLTSIAVLPIFFISYSAIILASIKFPFLVHIYVWNSLESKELEIKTDLEWIEFRNLSVKNTILTAISLGFYYPFAKIAMMKLKLESRIFRFETFQIEALEDSKGESALADEIADTFDFDFDIGL